MGSWKVFDPDWDDLMDSGKCPAQLPVQVRGDLPCLEPNQVNFTRRKQQLSQDEAEPSTSTRVAQPNHRCVQRDVAQGFSKVGQGTVDSAPTFGSDTRVDTSASFSTLFWNIDGIKSLTKRDSLQNYFENADIVQLVETNSINKRDIPKVEGYHVFLSLATKAVKGESERGLGIAVYVKTRCHPVLREELCSFTCICIDTAFARIYAYYFRPKFDIYQLVRQLVEDLLQVKGRIIVCGDFNCRIDQNYEYAKKLRGKYLLETMTFLGFHLISKPNEMTFSRQHNGKERSSCIDLVFAKGWDQSTLPTPDVIPEKSKKHKKILTMWNCPSKRKASNSMSLGGEESSQSAKIRSGKENEENDSEMNSLEDDNDHMSKETFVIVDKQRPENNQIRNTFAKGEMDKKRPLMYYDLTSPHEVVRCISELKLPLVNRESPTNVAERVPRVRLLFLAEDYWCHRQITEVEVSQVLEEARKSQVEIREYRTINSFTDQELAHEFQNILQRGTISLEDVGIQNFNSKQFAKFQLLITLLNRRLKRMLPSIEEEHKYSHGKSEETTLRVLLERVSPIIEEGQGRALFAVFVKLEPFQKLDKGTLCTKLQKLGVKGNFFRLLKSLLYDLEQGLTLGQDAAKGLPRVISRCHGLVLAYLSDLRTAILNQTCSYVSYGGDLVMYTEQKHELQPMIDRFSQWCLRSKMAVRECDLKVMTFCQKRLSEYNLDVSPMFMQKPIAQPGRVFFCGFIFKGTFNLDDQIASRMVKCTQIIGTLKKRDEDRRIFTRKEAVKVYREHILKIFLYGLGYTKPNLNAQVLEDLEVLKADFFRAALGFPKTLCNALVLHYAKCESMKDVKKYVDSDEYSIYEMSKTLTKDNVVYKSGDYEDLFKSDWFIRFLQMNPNVREKCKWWGFHRILCEKSDCIEIKDDCICKFCGQSAYDRHHVLVCGHPKAQSLRSLMKVNEKENVVDLVRNAAEIMKNELLTCHLEAIP